LDGIFIIVRRLSALDLAFSLFSLVFPLLAVFFRIIYLNLPLLRFFSTSKNKLLNKSVEITITDLDTNLTSTYESISKAAKGINTSVKSLTQYINTPGFEGVKLPYKDRYFIASERYSTTTTTTLKGASPEVGRSLPLVPTSGEAPTGKEITTFSSSTHFTVRDASSQATGFYSLGSFPHIGLFRSSFIP
jgi:hypothetical protein